LVEKAVQSEQITGGGLSQSPAHHLEPENAERNDIFKGDIGNGKVDKKKFPGYGIVLNRNHR